MSKEIKFNVILIIVLVLFSPLLIALGLRETPKSNQKPFGDHKKVYGEIVFKTNVVSEENNMLAVGLSFRNFNLQNKKDVSLLILSNGLDVRRASTNGASITDGGLTKFKFLPIVDSKDKTYQVEVSSKDSNEDNALQVFFESTGSDLNYQLFYKPKYLEIIKRVYGNWLEKFISDKLFFGTYLLLFLGLGVVIIKTKN